MHAFHPAHRRTSRLLTALVLTSALVVPLLSHATQAQAAQAGSATAMSAASPESTTGILTADGFTCHGIRCGYEFNKPQTKTIMTALTASGIVAAVAACNATPANTVVCAAIGAATGVVISKLIADYNGNKCLFVSPGPRDVLKLVDC
ncbi:MAG: hypothetical protein QOJ85_2608 [Solirubrobacteraceae bacterium]|nr:hypothetical protein [Solirubrobacteraceae bacterium]